MATAIQTEPSSLRVVEKYTSTTNVSLIFFQETISLPNLLKHEHDENMVIEKSRMNRSTDHNYCISMKLPLSVNEEDMVATLKVYAAKIEIRRVKPLQTLKEVVSKRLDKFGVSYSIKIVESPAYVDITLWSLGCAENLQDIEEKLRSDIGNSNLICNSPKFIFKGAFIHITGMRDEKYFKNVLAKFMSEFHNTLIAPCLTPSGTYSIMSNSQYNLGYKLNIFEVASLIRTAPGFENCFCLYNNLTSAAHYVVVYLRVNVSDKEKEHIRRKNLETSFTIKNTGAISQSNPTQVIGMRSLQLFLRAMEYLGDRVKR